jgi:hypothetical protein
LASVLVISIRASIGVQLQPAGEDVAGDVGGVASGGVSMGPQSDQGFGGLDLELCDQHACGLADLGAGEGVELDTGVAVGVGNGGLEVAIEEVEEGNRSEFGGEDGAGEVFAV